jgi:iron complex outermembrane receptor protein
MRIKAYNLAILAEVLLAFGLDGMLLARSVEPNEPGDFFEMSIEQLMEVPVVVSAARQAQKITELSVPVSVITAEDIHYSGLTHISEILQFSPGVDVLRLNRNFHAVGVRGLHETISNRTLALVDGRPAGNVIYGNPDFCRLPIFPEDIERIEVIRGPGGAAWGSSAFTGVINIITKDPEDALGYLGSTTVTGFGDTFSYLRWAQKQDKWSWRISAGYEDTVSSDDALGGDASYKSAYPSLTPLIGFDSFVARDFSRNVRLDSKAIHRLSETTEISMGAGYLNSEMGNYEVLGYFPMHNMRFEFARMFAKVDHAFEDGSSGYLQWSGNSGRENWPSYAIYRTLENDLECQINFAAARQHQLSIGGNFRWTHIRTARDTDLQYRYAGQPFDEYWTGLFAIDRWQVSDRLTIEGQLRGDYYSQSDIDWSGRLSGLYALDEAKDHIFRLSAAKAFRAPLVDLRKAGGHSIPLGGGSYLVNILLPVDDLKNEETWSLEAGYTGKLAEGLVLCANGYYQRLSELIGYRSSSDELGQMYYTADNIDGADSWGAEVELALEGKNRKISAWYAYNRLITDQSGQDIRGFPPAEHKTGLSGRVFLGNGWTFNANYRFIDTTPPNPGIGIDIAGSHRLDLTVAKTIAGGKGELMLGVSDLLNKTSDAIFESSNITAHEVPARTFFVRLQLKF